MASRHEIIGEEWKSRSIELADWAMERFVNRMDVWGQYSILTPNEQRKHGKSYKAMTLPRKSMRDGGDKVTLDKLARHFASIRNRKPQIIGLHAKCEKNTSRWLAIDIDLHEPDDPAAEVQAQRNLLAAMQWWKDFQKRGYDPLLTSSNGGGGHHLMIFFAEPAPTRDVYELGQEVIANWEALDLVAEPETFPRSEGRKESFGAWLRLPGMHHSREHYTTVWSGDEWLDDPWLQGHAAIDAILGVVPGPAPPKTKAAALGVRELAAPASTHPKRKTATRKPRPDFGPSGKPTVAVDFDGVLARFDGFQGATTFGEPIEGAVEFTRELGEWAEVLVATARLGDVEPGDEKARRKNEKIAEAVEDWLREHGFHFDRVHTESAKPRAHAYVDDRAVSCRPQVYGGRAFKDALERIEDVTGFDKKEC